MQHPHLRSHHRRRPHRLAAAALLAASLLPVAQAQQTLDLSAGPVDYTSWTLYGSATAQNLTPGNGFTYSVLTLTPSGIGDQAGAAFAPQALALDFNQPFSVHFNWYIPTVAQPGLRGDGMTFVLTTEPGLGQGGSGLGYDGSGPASVAWAIDTFHFQGEPVSPSLQILAGGSVTPLAVTETGLGDSVRDPDFQWFGQLDYQPSGLGDARGTLTASMTHLNLGSFSVSADVDFDALGMASAGAVYYGFTASNGLATDGHATSWGAPVPEPQTWLLMAAGLGMVGWLARRRAPQGGSRCS
jgi:hypothetical protein